MVRTYCYTYQTARLKEPTAAVGLGLPQFKPATKRYTVPMPKVMTGLEHLVPNDWPKLSEDQLSIRL